MKTSRFVYPFRAAIAAVRSRDYWFCLDHRDPQTTRALAVAICFLTLADASRPKRLPLVTLSAK